MSSAGETRQQTLTDAAETYEDQLARVREEATQGGARYGRQQSSAHDHVQLDEPEDCCQACGSQLTETFRQGMGDNNDIVWACVHCPEANKHGIDQTAGGGDS